LKYEGFSTWVKNNHILWINNNMKKLRDHEMNCIIPYSKYILVYSANLCACSIIIYWNKTADQSVWLQISPNFYNQVIAIIPDAWLDAWLDAQFIHSITLSFTLSKICNTIRTASDAFNNVCDLRRLFLHGSSSSTDVITHVGASDN
jgi:hypothetical protein